MDTILGLTICQPYAHMIASGEKLVENRRWATKYRGLLAIHAGVSTRFMRRGDERRYLGMRFGEIIAVARLVACLDLHEVRCGRIPDSLRWVRTHPHTEGPVCWVLSDVIPLHRPVQCRGELGLWELTSDQLQLVRVGMAVPGAIPAGSVQAH